MASVGAGRIRAFLALPLSDAFQVEVAPVLEKWMREFSAVRWVKPTEIHLTLHFFGSLEKEAVAQVNGLVRPLAQKCAPFEIFLQGTGAFPSASRPRVFWIGIKGTVESLRELHAGISGALSGAGFPVEERAFTPHLTVGRVRDGGKQRLPVNLDFPATRPRRMDRIVLFESHLTPSGAHYEVIGTYPFSETKTDTTRSS